MRSSGVTAVHAKSSCFVLPIKAFSTEGGADTTGGTSVAQLDSPIQMGNAIAQSVATVLLSIPKMFKRRPRDRAATVLTIQSHFRKLSMSFPFTIRAPLLCGLVARGKWQEIAALRLGSGLMPRASI